MTSDYDTFAPSHLGAPNRSSYAPVVSGMSEAAKAHILELIARRERGEDVGGIVFQAETAEELREQMRAAFQPSD